MITQVSNRCFTLSKINKTFRSIHLLKQKAFVNGEWLDSPSRKSFEVRNPANDTVIGSVPNWTAEEAKQAINAAEEAFEQWKETTAKERAVILRNWFNLLEKNKDSLAKILTAESGKPLAESQVEVSYGNSFIEWFSEQARNIRGEIIPSPIKSKKIMIEHQPIGVVGLITPWNFPHAMITRKAGAALAAGCTVVIKPAEDTPFTALAITQLAEEAGMPKGVVNVVTSARENAAAIGQLFCESPKIAGISFTGSTQVGQILYKQCSSRIKRLGLELGGNAPFIVFNSANINKAVEEAIASKFRNCGQTCVSSNRFLIQDKVFDQFVPQLVSKINEMKMGDGMTSGVQLGPLINEMQMQKISNYVEDAISKGAKILTGGEPAPDLGKLFYKPTVLTNLTPNMKIYSEEVFGPIVSIIPFNSEQEGIDIANSTDRGLAGYIFSEDVSQIFRVTKKLEVGMVGVNDGRISTCEAPFGGVKQSGIGREGSHLGTEEYSYVKYICLGGLE